MAITNNVSGNSFKRAIHSAKSVEETVNALRGMESFFVETQLGTECFLVAEKLFQLRDFHQVLTFGERALTIFLHRNNNDRESCLLLARVLLLLARSCFNLKKYDECLSYLNRANTHMSNCFEDNGSNVVETLLDIEMELYYVKDAMGKREDAVVHVLNVLKIKERTMRKDSIDIGDANVSVSEAYLRALDHRGALPYCSKALEIYEKRFGINCLEVAEVRRSLALIYQDMREFNSALELNQLAVSVFKKRARDAPELLVIAETEGAYTLIELGRYDEAVDAMKDVVSRRRMKGWLRVKSSLTMAKALCYSGKFADAEEYIRVPRKMLEGKQIEDPMLVSAGFSELSLLYQKKNDLDTAISMMKRAIAMPGLPQRLMVQLCESLMSLISEFGKEKDEVPYMVDAVEKLKDTFGPEHCVVGYGYSSLGATCLKSGQMELLATSLANAKDILDVTLGPNHLTSLKISHGLSVAHAALGRLDQALVIEEKVIEGLKGLKASDPFPVEAREHLSKLKDRVAESSTGASSQSKDDEDLAEKITQGGISEEENLI